MGQNLDKYQKEKSDHKNMVEIIEMTLNIKKNYRSDRDKHELKLSTSTWHDKGIQFYFYGE
jgi:hypothetical protein